MSRAKSTSQAHAEVPPEPVKDPFENVDADEAWKRFAPFVFTIDSDTKDTVDLKGTLDILARDPNLAVGTNCYILDKKEVLEWFAALDPAFSHGVIASQQIGEAKAQLATLIDGGGDIQLVAMAFKMRLRYFALVREAQRLEEVEAAQQRHEDLVERLMEEGLSRREAEAAAREEEAAQEAADEEALAAENAGEEGDLEVSTRPVTYAFLKGFPTVTDHVKALLNIGLVLNGVLVVNSKAKFGRRDDPVPLDAKGKGKKPEPKKAEVKKAAKGKGAEDVPPPPTESLGVLLARDVAKLPKFEPHPLTDVLVWVNDIHCLESVKHLDEAQAAVPGAGWDLQETEGEVAERLAAKILSLEQAGLTYQQWNAAQAAQPVPLLLLPADGGSTARTQRPMTTETPAPIAEEVKKPTKPPPAPKKGGKAVKKEEEVAPVDLAPPPPPPPPPLPSTVEELPANNDLYQRLVDEVSTGNTSTTVQLHCILEQVQETNASEGGADAGKSAALAVADTIAVKNRRDVADFADYVLATLDGQQEVVFEACRRRRLKAAEASADADCSAEGGSLNNTMRGTMLNVPFHVGDSIRLNAHTLSTLDGGALLLGLPLTSIEARLCQAAYKQSTFGQTVTVKTDFPNLSTFEDAQHLTVQLLREKCGMSITEAQSLVSSRNQAEILSARQYGERISDVSLFSSSTKVVEAHCLDGSKVIILLHSHPTERKRWRSTWCHLHGHMTFPRWLEWQEHVAKEDLFFNPPPKNDDDDDEDDAPQDEVEEEEEEEEEEDEEEFDDEGNLVKKEPRDDDDLDLDLEEEDRPKRRKKKKVIHYDPEYVDFELQATEEQRRRATMEHLRSALARGAPTKGVASEKRYQSLLANNHSASVAYEEESFMFPDDGNVIATSVSRINTVGVNCSVHCGQGLLFGFRSTVPSNGRPPLDLHGPEKKSGVSGVISIRNEALVHIECTAIAAPIVHYSPTPAVMDAHLDTAGAGGDAASEQSRSETPAGGVPVVMPTINTVVRLSTKGLTLTVDTEKGAILFEMAKENARDCPVTVYHAPTKQAVRIFVAEVSRTVLPNGSVLSTYSDGTKMNLFPSGNTSVLHKGTWMITNSQGRRVLKNAETGQLSPVVRSLVTTNTDVETQSKVTTREDGVVTVHYDDGRMLVQHIEGTRMWQDANRSIIEIETEGMPLVACTDSPVSRLSPTPSPTPIPGDEPAPDRESLLCVKFQSGLYLSARPKKRVTMGHFHMGFQAVLELSAYTMRVVPSIEHDNTYSVDYAFGGLRSTDQAFAYNVTPFGRTRSRNLEEETTEVVLDPTVKQVIDVFGGLEIVNSLFADQIVQTGFDVNTQSLHRQTTAQVSERTLSSAIENDTVGFAPPPRSRQMKDKERQCVNKMRSLIPEKASDIPHNLPPHIFLVQPNGSAFELFRREDVKDIVKGAVAHSDLLHSDVFKKKIPVGAAAAAAEQEGSEVVANVEGNNYYEHTIMSVSPVRPTVRPGIPKIILDIRSGHSSAPMSVSHFLQELRQGPSHAHGQQQSDTRHIGDLSVSCTTRHLIHFPGSNLAEEVPSTKAPEDKRPLPFIMPYDPVYEEAAASLAAAIPPVIAAQLSIQRTAQQIAMGREALGKATRQGSRSQSKDGPKSRGNLPSRRQGGAYSPPRSGAAQTDAKKGEQDEEFAKQMEELRAKERANRKPWPDPISDLKAKKAGIVSAGAPGGSATGGANVSSRGTFQFWATDEGAERVDAVTAENEKFKAKNGYVAKKVDNTTASPVKPPSTRKPIDGAPPVRVIHQDATPRPVPTASHVNALAVTNPANNTTGGGSHAKSGLSHTTVGSNKVGSTSMLRSAAKRIVATPNIVNFGNGVEGFRYSTAIQLTNVAVGACRYSLSVPSEYSSWLSVDATKAPIAAGMSARIDIEVGGTQPVGTSEGAIVVDYEGGQTIVEVIVMTRSQNDKPVPHPRGVRMIGPVKLHYKPGGTVKTATFDNRSRGPVSMENPKFNTLDEGNDSD